MNNLPREIVAKILSYSNIFSNIIAVCRIWHSIYLAAICNYKKQFRNMAYKVVRDGTAQAYLFDMLVYDVKIHNYRLTINKYDHINNISTKATYNIAPIMPRKRVRVAVANNFCLTIKITMVDGSTCDFITNPGFHWKFITRCKEGFVNNVDSITQSSIWLLLRYMKNWKLLDVNKSCKKTMNKIYEEPKIFSYTAISNFT